MAKTNLSVVVKKLPPNPGWSLEPRVLVVTAKPSGKKLIEEKLARDAKWNFDVPEGTAHVKFVFEDLEQTMPMEHLLEEGSEVTLVNPPDDGDVEVILTVKKTIIRQVKNALFEQKAEETPVIRHERKAKTITQPADSKEVLENQVRNLEKLLNRANEGTNTERVKREAAEKEVEALRKEMAQKVSGFDKKEAEWSKDATARAKDLAHERCRSSKVEADAAELNTRRPMAPHTRSDSYSSAKSEEDPSSQEDYESMRVELQSISQTIVEVKTEFLEIGNSLNEVKSLGLKIDEARKESQNVKSKCEVMQKMTEECVKAKVDYRSLLDAKTKELVAKDTELSTKTKELEAKDTELSTKTKELEAKDTELSTKTKELEAKDTELSTKTKELEAKDTELSTKTKELEAKDTELSTKTKEQETELQIKTSAIFTLEREVVSLRTQQAASVVSLEENASTISDLKNELLTKTANSFTITSLQQEAHRLREKANAAEKERDELRSFGTSREKALRSELEDTNSLMETRTTALGTKTKELEKLRTQVTSLEKDCASKTSTMTSLQDELNSKSIELSELKFNSGDQRMIEEFEKFKTNAMGLKAEIQEANELKDQAIREKKESKKFHKKELMSMETAKFEYLKKTKESYDQLQMERDALQKKFDQTTQDLPDQLGQLMREKDALQESLECTQKQMATLKEILSYYTSEVNHGNRNRTSAIMTPMEKEDTRSLLVDQKGRIEKEKESLAVMKKAAEERDAAVVESNCLSKKLKIIEEDLKYSQEALSKLEDELVSTKKQKVQHQESVTQAAHAKITLEKENRELKEKSKDRDDLQTRNRQMEEDIQQAKDQIDQLEERIKIQPSKTILKNQEVQTMNFQDRPTIELQKLKEENVALWSRMEDLNKTKDRQYVQHASEIFENDVLPHLQDVASKIVEAGDENNGNSNRRCETCQYSLDTIFSVIHQFKSRPPMISKPQQPSPETQRKRLLPDQSWIIGSPPPKRLSTDRNHLTDPPVMAIHRQPLPSSFLPGKALLVGCLYQNNCVGPVLTGPANDVRNWFSTLTISCGWSPSNVVTLCAGEGQLATKSNVTKQVELLLTSAQRGETVFLLFSGKGAQLKKPAAPRGPATHMRHPTPNSLNRKSYSGRGSIAGHHPPGEATSILLCEDYDYNSISKLRPHQGTILVSYLKSQFYKLQGANLVMVFDCCHGDMLDIENPTVSYPLVKHEPSLPIPDKAVNDSRIQWLPRGVTLALNPPLEGDPHPAPGLDSSVTEICVHNESLGAECFVDSLWQGALSWGTARCLHEEGPGLTVGQLEAGLQAKADSLTNIHLKTRFAVRSSRTKNDSVF